MKIKQRLTITVGIAIALTAALIAGYFSYQSELNVAKQIVFENLKLNHSLTVANIEGNFNALKSEMEVLSHNKELINFLQYSKAKNKELDSWAKGIVSHFGYYDLLLINARGDVVYTVAKESDLNTNLVSGPYANSGLGQLFKKIKKSGNFELADFSVYAPSNNQLAAFFGVPLFKNNTFLGIMAIQISTSFEKLTIGVHIPFIKDYIQTSKFTFNTNNEFLHNKSMPFELPSTSPSVQNDTLFVTSELKIAHLVWKVIGVVAPVVFKKQVHWYRIVYHSSIAFIISLMALAGFINWQYQKQQILVYKESEVVLVQNTWHQFMAKKPSFGADFYYRLKNKARVLVETEVTEIDELGTKIEQYITELTQALDNPEQLAAKLKQLATLAINQNLEAKKLNKLPALVIESIEDEYGHPLPQRARQAWQKVLSSLTAQVITLLKYNPEAS